jgi:hypothetical protein
MTPSWQLEVKMKNTYFLDLKMNLREAAMKYGRLVVLYVTIPLGYGGFGMDSHLASVL